MLLLSFVPLSELSAAAAVSLGLMHLAVGATIIVAMRRSSPARAVAPS